jgi:predicted nucleotidyltransferase
MSNLALLHSKSGKPRKSLAICLKGISIMEEHLDNMHQMKNKKRMIEDGVIFVNLLLIAKRNINRIMKKCNEELLYRKLLNMINKRGYNFSIKYLGSTSIFTSKFEIDESTIDLPIYDESFSQSEQNQLQNDF